MCKRFPKCLFYGNKKLSLFFKESFYNRNSWKEVDRKAW